MQRASYRYGLLIAAALRVGLASGDASAQQTVEVKADQTVTVSGSFPSLQSLVEDLCWRAGVQVIAYDAPDRPVAGQYENVPLQELLRRLLRTESFTIGLRAGASQKALVSWVRVMGDHEQATSGANRRVPVVEGAGDFRVPPAMMLAAFNQPAGPEQEAALQQLAGRIASDPQELKTFLAVDPKVIAGEVGRYPQVRAHLDAVLLALPAEAN